ncbi:unnamed protein product [Lota lota]
MATTTAGPITTERPTLAPPLSAVTSSQTAFTSPPTVRPGQLTTAQKTTTTAEKETANTQRGPTTTHQALDSHHGNAAAAAPGCPVRRASDALSGVSGDQRGPLDHPRGPQTTALSSWSSASSSPSASVDPTAQDPSERYCDDSDLWYRKHTSEVCPRLKRVSFSRNALVHRKRTGEAGN